MLPFIFLIGSLVFFHELGHFIVARACGVKCERFAVGIGPVIWSFVRGETEFSIRALPFGGYVSMLGAQPDEETDEADVGRRLTDKPFWQRFAILFAGPLMNLLIPIPIYFTMIAGVEGETPAVVGSVFSGSAAEAAGLRSNDRVLSVNGTPIRFFNELRAAVVGGEGAPLALTVDRDGKTVEIAATPQVSSSPDRYVKGRSFSTATLGVSPAAFAAVLNIQRDSAAWNQGLRPFDKVLRVGTTPVRTFYEFRRELQRCATPCALQVLRPTRAAEKALELMVQMPVEVVLPGGGRIEQLGIAAAETSVFDVAPGGPAAAAGIAPGDIILSIDGAPVGELSTFARRIEAASKPSFEVRVMRNLEEFKVDYRPVSIWTKDDMGVEQLHLDLGLSAVPGGFAYVFPEDIPFTGGERIERAVKGAWSESAGLAVSMVVGVYHMVTGRVSLSNIGGPVMMAEMANRSASEGLLSYFDMLARVSISLAIMNLLPVPGLDGGQILLFAAEAISRRPLSFRSRQIVQYVGLASLLALMTLAFVNDLKRHWDAFAQRISSWFV